MRGCARKGLLILVDGSPRCWYTSCGLSLVLENTETLSVLAFVSENYTDSLRSRLGFKLYYSWRRKDYNGVRLNSSLCFFNSSTIQVDDYRRPPR